MDSYLNQNSLQSFDPNQITRHQIKILHQQPYSYCRSPNPDIISKHIQQKSSRHQLLAETITNLQNDIQALQNQNSSLSSQNIILKNEIKKLKQKKQKRKKQENLQLEKLQQQNFSVKKQLKLQQAYFTGNLNEIQRLIDQIHLVLEQFRGSQDYGKQYQRTQRNFGFDVKRLRVKIIQDLKARINEKNIMRHSHTQSELVQRRQTFKPESAKILELGKMVEKLEIQHYKLKKRVENQQEAQSTYASLTPRSSSTAFNF